MRRKNPPSAARYTQKYHQASHNAGMGSLLLDTTSTRTGRFSHTAMHSYSSYPCGYHDSILNYLFSHANVFAANFIQDGIVARKKKSKKMSASTLAEEVAEPPLPTDLLG